MDTLGIKIDYLWSSVLDSLPIGLSLHSTSGEIIWANQKLCEIYDKSLFDLQGSTCQQAFHGGESACPHEQALATGRRIRLDGTLNLSERTFSLQIEPLFDEDGTARGFLRLLADVTQEHRDHEQMIQAERLATLGQILSGVAHDVGTPLNVISGYSEYLLMKTVPDGQGHKELSSIVQQTRRIASIFSDALDLARPSQGKKVPIEPKPMLMGVLDLVGHPLRKADVKVAMTCTIVPPLIYGEAPQLRQALFNLLLNAGLQMSSGGRLDLVIEEATDRPEFLLIQVWGTEAGGALHDFSRSLGCLFSSTLDAGTIGIGLSLARQILNDAGALIQLGGVCERGTPLMVYLPVYAGGRA